MIESTAAHRHPNTTFFPSLSENGDENSKFKKKLSMDDKGSPLVF